LHHWHVRRYSASPAPPVSIAHGEWWTGGAERCDASLGLRRPEPHLHAEVRPRPSPGRGLLVPAGFRGAPPGPPYTPSAWSMSVFTPAGTCPLGTPASPPDTTFPGPPRLVPDLAVDDADFEEDDDGDLSLPKPSEALRQIVMGEPLVAEAPELYCAGLSAVYDHIGRILSNSAFAPAGWEFVKQVDAALVAEGMPEPLRAVTLFSRGFPLLAWPRGTPKTGH
jgi:hypothetical protein